LSILVAPSAVDAGEFLVSDQASSRVLAFDDVTGALSRVVTSNGLDLPSSLTFGPGGFLYAANFGAYADVGSAASVVKIDPATGETTPFITDVAGPGGVAYHAGTNSLFVSKLADFVLVDGVPTADFAGNVVHQYDESGALVRTIGMGSPATGRTGMTFDADGNLYVSEFNIAGVGSVLKYDAANEFAPLGAFATGAGVQLLIPAPPGGFNGLSFDAHGDLFVASLIGQAMIKFPVTEGTAGVGVPFGAPMAYPSGIAIAPDGDLLVGSLGNNNPSDPFYGSTLFPGVVLKLNAATGAAATLLAGDLDRSAVVDAADLAAWQASFDQGPGGDLDGDGDSDGGDFLVWQRSVGNEGITGAFLPSAIVHYIPPPAATAIPEPASMWLATAVVAALLASRQRPRA
jgi:sugar lactone lactonase YvrE